MCKRIFCCFFKDNEDKVIFVKDGIVDSSPYGSLDKNPIDNQAEKEKNALTESEKIIAEATQKLNRLSYG